MLRKVLQYLHYFTQSVLNRGFNFTFRLLYHEYTTERKLGINSLQIENLDNKTLASGYSEAFHHYQGASYYITGLLFNALPTPLSQYSLLDMGCGKGRILVYALYRGMTRAEGLDIAQELCSIAEQNLALAARKRQQNWQYAVYFADAGSFEIAPHTNLLFLFNPFNEAVMVQVRQQVLASLETHPRPFWVVYVNPVYPMVWLQAGFELYHELTSSSYIEGIVFKKGISEKS
jgi:16S rRNA G966 N2-methylase RsmD